MIQILTYKNPKDLEKREFYKDICNYPNLCASETLKMGLTSNGRDHNYEYIYTIDNLITEIYKEWLDPVNQIKQMNSLTRIINTIDNINLKNSFKFNKSELLNALRFLVEMDVKPELINESDEVIKEFKLIYSKLIKGEDEWKTLNLINKMPADILEQHFKILRDNEEKELKRQGIPLKIGTEKNKDCNFNKLVINGLHRFTPIIFRLIDDLIESGIQIIFVINYMDEYPEIYKTWEEVYAWTGLPINPSSEEITDRNNLGKALGELLNGNISEFNNKNIEFIKYDNLSSFADKVSESYKATIDIDNNTRELHTVGNISKMKEQFYSAKMEDINNLLKQYHPLQFGDKHFLAYPIGQFILSIYNMWDNEEKKLLIDSNNLKQCISLGFFNNEKYNCLDIYNRLESYYLNLKIKEIHTVSDLKDNINKLKGLVLTLSEREKVEKKSSTLRRFSFYNVRVDELEHFNKIIGIIDDIGNEIFKESSGILNFYNHYKNLINVIKSNIDMEKMTKKERDMIDELDNRFKNLEKVKVDGDIENVRDSLHFYLNRIEEIEANKHQASWIVRNLEHLDGGVLLESKEDKIFHLCLIGDIDMNPPIKNLLPYPLTLKFFDSLETPKRRHKSIMKSYQERSNFLRYCLFYGCFYLNSNIKVSYIQNYQDEINPPYYLLKMLGIEFENDSPGFPDDDSKPSNKNKDIYYRNSFKKPIKDDEMKNFLYCEYKYFLEDVIEGDTFFYNEFTQKKYYETLLLYESHKKIKSGDKNSIEEIVRIQNEFLKSKFFYVWKEVIFKDAYIKVVDTLKDNVNFSEEYFDIRKKFIFAKLTDEDKEGKNVIINLHKINNRNAMIYKRQISQKLMGTSPLNTANSLEKCKYCGVNEICLERYRSL